MKRPSDRQHQIAQLLVFAALYIVAAAPLHALPKMCHSQVACTAGAGGCIRIPTSLPPVSVIADTDDGYFTGGQCGATEAGEACGVPFGVSPCPDESGGGGTGCDCGPGIGPCAQFANQEPLDEQIGPTDAGVSELSTETRLIHAQIQSIANSGLPPELASLWNGLASLSSIHFRASMEVSKLTPAITSPPMTGAGFYEYWEQGPLYRVSSRVGPEALNLATISEIAFNGHRFAMRQRDSGLAILSLHDRRFYPIPMRNPLLLPLSFASLFNAAVCPRCENRLVDLHAANPIINSHDQPGFESFIKTPSVPGEQQAASFYSFLVTNQGKWDEKQVLELHSSQGRVLEHIELSRFNSVKGASDLRVPWTIIHQYNSPSGKPHLTYTFKIEAVEANRPYDISLFQVDDFGATTWNDDQRR